MKTAIILVLLLAGLTACANEKRWSEFRQTEAALHEAREQATIDCSGVDLCARAWRRTKQYVAQNATTQVDEVNDTTIRTLKPHEFGVVYLWAVMEPLNGVGDRARIRLKGMCRGMYRAEGGPAMLYTSCAEQIREVELNFRRFVLATG